MTKDKLIAELTEKLGRVPGYVPGFLQPIQNRILMISTGIRAQVGIKVLGDDLDAIQKKAFEIERVIRTIPGAVGVAASRMQGKPYLNIEINRTHLAHYGLRAEDILNVIEAGIGGMNVSTVIDGRERIPIQVRLERGERDDIEGLGDILVPAGHETNTFRSARSQPSPARQGRMKLTATTGACASLCRPMWKAATSGASSRTRRNESPRKFNCRPA